MTKSKIYLLDSNVLIALATPEHSLNARAAAWFLEGHRFATCPITQGALFRFHLRAGVEATVDHYTLEPGKPLTLRFRVRISDLP